MRYSTVSKRMLEMVRPVVLRILLFADRWLFVTLIHLMSVVAGTILLRAIVTQSLFADIMRALPLDDVHTALVVETMNGVSPIGVAVAGFPGQVLHRWLPWLFASPTSISACCLLNVVMDSASPIAGVALVRATVLVLMIAIGLTISSKPALAKRIGTLGHLLIGYGVFASYSLRWGLPELEAMGLAAIATKVLGLEGQTYQNLLATHGAWLPLAVKSLVVVSGFLAGIVTILSLRALGRHSIRRIGAAPETAKERTSCAGPSISRRSIAFRFPGLAREFAQRRLDVGSSLAAIWVVAAFVVGFRGSVVYAGLQPAGSGAEPLNVETVEVQGSTAPSIVRVEATAQGFAYFVNGRQEAIRGFGYNPIDRQESVQASRVRMEKDFLRMRLASANAVTGWNQSSFDETLMNAAAKQGLGVILPFELPVTANYSDQNVRHALLGRVRLWVERYRSHPALRMWAIGNEALHDLAAKDDTSRLACARFIIEAADLVHSIDPNHPVVYREAEDAFMPVLQDALASSPAKRPWLVFGLNFFTPRLETAVSEAIRRWPNSPLLISEFAPFGVHPSGRPTGYVGLWRLVRRFPNNVLGGLAYVWYRHGPEAVDTTFGMVDDDGNAVDATLDAIGYAYRESARRSGEKPFGRITHGALP